MVINKSIHLNISFMWICFNSHMINRKLYNDYLNICSPLRIFSVQTDVKEKHQNKASFFREEKMNYARRNGIRQNIFKFTQTYVHFFAIATKIMEMQLSPLTNSSIERELSWLSIGVLNIL